MPTRTCLPMLLGAVLLAIALTAGAANADVLATVRARGVVLCGSAGQSAGISATLSGTTWAGLGADYCRGLAAVIFSDASKVQFVSVAPDERLNALTTGRVDALADLLPWTLSADTGPDLIFIGTLFYDGQGFMVQKTSGLRSARDLAGKPVCVVAGESEAALSEYFGANNISAKPLPVADAAAATANYVAGTCSAISADSSALANLRAALPTPADHVLLPDLIGKKPLGLVVRQGDDRWFDIARWTFYALLDAEELGVTQTNVDEMLGSDNISIRRLLGVEGDFGVSIGLNKDWAYQLIKNVGNYADIYDRNIGDPTTLKLPRGLNALWNKGGIQYAPPVR